MKVLWEGGILGKEYTVKVETVGDNLYRGILKIYNKENNVVFQKEVSATQGGVDKVNINDEKQWSAVISKWVKYGR